MALDGGEWLFPCPSSFIHGTLWRLDVPHRQSEHFVEQKKSPASARNQSPRPSTGNLRNMFKKDSKNVCTRTAVVSADSSSPIPWTPQLQALQKTSSLHHPELPDEGDIQMEYSSDYFYG